MKIPRLNKEDKRTRHVFLLAQYQAISLAFSRRNEKSSQGSVQHEALLRRLAVASLDQTSPTQSRSSIERASISGQAAYAYWSADMELTVSYGSSDESLICDETVRGWSESCASRSLRCIINDNILARLIVQFYSKDVLEEMQLLKY